MPVNTLDQQITMPIGADAADNPVAFVNMVADVEARLVRNYTDTADRTARQLSVSENQISTLATENRVEIYDGTNNISLYPRTMFAYLRTASNQTLTPSSTALQNVTTLVAAMPTAGNFSFRSTIWYSSATAADIKLAYAIPAGATLLWNGLGVVIASGTTGDATFSTLAASDASVSYGGAGVGVILCCRIEGVYVAGGTAGNLQLRAAQSTADASNTVIHQHSRMEVWRSS